MSQEETVEVPVDVLAEQAFTLGPEFLSDDDMNMLLPGDDTVEFPSVSSLEGTWEDVDTITDTTRGWGVVFHGTTHVKESRRVSAGNYHHPPEYETTKLPVAWSLAFFPNGDGGWGAATFSAEGI